jgi:hypothetical protein
MLYVGATSRRAADIKAPLYVTQSLLSELSRQGQADQGRRVSDAPPKVRRRDRPKGPGSGKPAPSVIVSHDTFDEIVQPEKKKGGRPSQYSEKVADEICQWLGLGKSMRSYCEQDDTVDRGTIIDWRKAHPDFDARSEKRRTRVLMSWPSSLLIRLSKRICRRNKLPF